MNKTPLPLLTFVVRDPISVNEAYIRPRNGGRVFKSKNAKDFAERIREAALIAKQKGQWPALDRLSCVELAYQLYDTKLDTDGPRKALRDACEGILYENDRIVQDGPAPIPIKDGNGRRVVVTVKIVKLKPAPICAERA